MMVWNKTRTRLLTLLYSVLPLILVFIGGNVIAADGGFGSFEDEANRLTVISNCNSPKHTAPSGGYGRLYGCIFGRAETVKLFANEVAGTGRVANVKLMWNDWHKDTGYGIHADRNTAQGLLYSLAKTYAPSLSDELHNSFFGSNPMSLSTDSLNLEYRFWHGPAINEHLLIITEK